MKQDLEREGLKNTDGKKKTQMERLVLNRKRNTSFW